MTHFIAWMILYPITIAICEKLNPINKEHSDDTLAAYGFVQLCIWFGVGALIWNEVVG